MAKQFNHNGQYGTNAIGKDKFRNVESPEKLKRPVDLADFQFSPIPLGMTDGDAFFNCGGNGFQINIIVEFKEEALTRRLVDGYKHEAIPMGQRIAFENIAKGIHDTSVKGRIRQELLQGNNDIDINAIETTRQPGTASIIILATHPDEEYPSGAEAIVESVFWAHDAYSKTAPTWQLPNGKGIKPTLAQFLDMLSRMLEVEAPEANPVTKFRKFAKAGLAESGQQSLLKA